MYKYKTLLTDFEKFQAFKGNTLTYQKIRKIISFRTMKNKIHILKIKYKK